MSATIVPHPGAPHPGAPDAGAPNASAPNAGAPLPGAPPGGTPAEISPKRRAILDAAAELFMAVGYGAVSMDAVARSAQVSKATLYAHFTGKDALFAEIIGTSCARLQSSVAVALSGHALPLRAALTEMGTQWLRFLLQPRVRALHRVVIGEGGRFPDLARIFYENGPQALRRWLAEWLVEEGRRGRLRPDTDPALAAEQFLALLRGDLFVRATLGLLEEVREAEIGALALTAAVAIDRLHGVESGQPPAGPTGQEGFA